MKAWTSFALLAGMAMASAIPAQQDPKDSSLNVTSNSLHDLYLNINKTNENKAVVQYIYQPGTDFYKTFGLSNPDALVPRSLVNIPALNQRISVAFALASVTLIRTGNTLLEIVVDNLDADAIIVGLNWVVNQLTENVPGSATTTQTIDIGNAGNGQITITVDPDFT